MFLISPPTEQSEVMMKSSVSSNTQVSIVHVLNTEEEYLQKHRKRVMKSLPVRTRHLNGHIGKPQVILGKQHVRPAVRLESRIHPFTGLEPPDNKKILLKRRKV